MNIATAVSFHNFLHLPPMMGMMTGLAYLKNTHKKVGEQPKRRVGEEDERLGDTIAFYIFRNIALAVWDTYPIPLPHSCLVFL